MSCHKSGLKDLTLKKTGDAGLTIKAGGKAIEDERLRLGADLVDETEGIVNHFHLLNLRKIGPCEDDLKRPNRKSELLKGDKVLR